MTSLLSKNIGNNCTISINNQTPAVITCNHFFHQPKETKFGVNSIIIINQASHSIAIENQISQKEATLQEKAKKTHLLLLITLFNEQQQYQYLTH